MVILRDELVIMAIPTLGGIESLSTKIIPFSCALYYSYYYLIVKI